MQKLKLEKCVSMRVWFFFSVGGLGRGEGKGGGGGGGGCRLGKRITKISKKVIAIFSVAVMLRFG